MVRLQEMLRKEPNDAFLLYGLALEHKKLGQYEQAISLLNRLLELHADHCAAHHQRGQTYELAGQRPAARQAYREGIAAAIRVGNGHARREMEQELFLLE